MALNHRYKIDVVGNNNVIIQGIGNSTVKFDLNKIEEIKTYFVNNSDKIEELLFSINSHNNKVLKQFERLLIEVNQNKIHTARESTKNNLILMLVVSFLPVFILFFFNQTIIIPLLKFHIEFSISTIGLYVIIFGFVSLSFHILSKELLKLLQGYNWDEFPGLKPVRIAKTKKYINLYKKLKYQSQHDQSNNKSVINLQKYFPLNLGNIMPTKLGNIISSIENYSYDRYGIDKILWDRFTTILRKENYYKKVLLSEALLYFLTNILIILIFLYIEFFFVFIYSLKYFSLAFSTILFLSLLKIVYYLIIHSAINWGNKVKASFDLYRFKFAKELNLKRISNTEEEKEMWKAVSDFFLTGKSIDKYINY